MKKKSGRPKKPNPFGEVARFACTAGQKELFEKAAAATGKLFSEWARDHLELIANRELGKKAGD